MKLLMVAAGVLMVGQVNAACQDRYYYYRPTLTVTNVQNLQVYDDKDFLNSREHSDIEKMVKECGSAAIGGKYNIQAIVNIVVPANFYKLKKPLFGYPNIRLPNGVNGGQSVYLDIRQRPGFSSVQAQHSGEVRKDGSVGLVQVYLVRDGQDDLKTPEWFYQNHSYLTGKGYSYTTFK